MGLNIINNKYNKLTAIEFSHKEGRQNRQKWLFRCKCGAVRILDKGKVTGGYTKSCGCLLIQNRNSFVLRSTTHGLSGGRAKKKPEYKSWCSMKGRCCNQKNKAFKDYGGRGIKVCDRWLNSFENFLADMGERPTPKHSIDRINNDGNYEPSNCRWATRLQQGRNKRGVKLVTINKETRCITEWIEHLGLNKKDVDKALYRNKINIKDILR